MDDQAEDINRQKTVKAFSELEEKFNSMLGTLAAQVAFLCLGLGLTFAAYASMNLYIEDLVRKEYTRMTQNTVDSFSRGLNDLGGTVDTLAGIMALNVEEGMSARSPESFSRQIQRLVPEVVRFDQVFWVHPEINNGRLEGPVRWVFSPVYVHTQARTHFGSFNLRATQDLLQAILHDQNDRGAQTRILYDVPALQDAPTSAPANSGADLISTDTRPFLMVRPVRPGQNSAGYIAALGHLGPVINTAGVYGNTSLTALLTVRDVLAGKLLFSFRRGFSAQYGYYDMGEVYEFNFSGRRLEIRTRYTKEPKILFMESVPMMLGVFGLIFTLLGLVYVRHNRKIAEKINLVNKRLEDKQTELEAEIAKRARLNKALRKSESENRSIIDSVRDVIFELDSNGCLVFLSAAWRSITGFEPEQSTGLDLFMMLHSDDQDKQKKDFEIFLKGHKGSYRSFTQIRTAEGKFRAVELAISMVRHDNNQKLRIVGTLTDVEDRRRAERALGEAEKKYRTIVENAAGGIFQITPEGVYLSANPALARILGYSSAEDVLRNIKNANDTIYVDRKERIKALQVLENFNVLHNHEAQVYRSDGAIIWVNENMRTVRDDSNNVLYFEGSMEDITERKNAEIELRNAKIQSDLANRAKSEFLSNMSHELRTPLNAIIGFSELIANEAFGPIQQQEYKEYGSDINQSGRQLYDIINEILDISRIEAGDRQLNEEIVNLNEIAMDCLALLSDRITDNNLTVDNQLTGLPVRLIAEKVAVKQIIMNLMSNAVKFTPDGGRIGLSASMTGGGELQFSVTDTGVGLSQSDIEKALSPFGQVDNALSRSNSGTGLGLTLVKALAGMHGGELEILSQKGIGTTATVIFPASRVRHTRSSEKHGGEHNQKQDEGSSQ